MKARKAASAIQLGAPGAWTWTCRYLYSRLGFKEQHALWTWTWAYEEKGSAFWGFFYKKKYQKAGILGGWWIRGQG
jgi:hypothetical protein